MNAGCGNLVLLHRLSIGVFFFLDRNAGFGMAALGYIDGDIFECICACPPLRVLCDIS